MLPLSEIAQEAMEPTKITLGMFLLCISTGCGVSLTGSDAPNNDCGMPVGSSSSSRPRIGSVSPPQSFVVGGTTEPDIGFPWVVNVKTEDGMCHGTLIDSSWVLTAAHCMPQSNDISKSVTVSYTRNNNSATSGEQFAASICTHPQWDPSPIKFGDRYDIALLQLSTPWGGRRFLNPAYLPWASAPSGSPVVLASGNETPGTDQVLHGTIVSSGQACRFDNALCVESMPAVICEGDSGSGLINNSTDPMSGSCPIVTGIAVEAVAIGSIPNCNDSNTPFIATDVFAYLDWIKRNTGIVLPSGHCQPSN
jgi:hypothetical protein